VKKYLFIASLASIFIAAGCLTTNPEGANGRTIKDLNLVMINVQPGEFVMGSDQWAGDEKPAHKVRITNEFWIGRTEVTQAQYEKIMGNNPSLYAGDNSPVEQVSWKEAMEFCRKLTESEKKAGSLPAGYAYRLPTEAEWEYACRAGTTGDYSGKVEDISWNGTNSKNSTQDVATKSPNPWGIYDMHGNVWEWCMDSCNYGENGVSNDTFKEGQVNPCSVKGDNKLLKGGSWCFDPKRCRSSARYADSPDFKAADIGFRIVLAQEIKP